MITPARNNILFAFMDDTNRGDFYEQSESGIILGKETTDQMMNKARWGKVLAVGPLVSEISAGDTVLIEPLMWTEGFNHDDVKIWKTDDTKIMMVEVR